MPAGLKRLHSSGNSHFITVSCFRRKPFLGTPELRSCFQAILLSTAERYDFELTAYVIMPEHIHLVLSEPRVGLIATVLQVLKQRYSTAMKKVDPAFFRRLEQKTAHPPPCPVWETRYYDFNLTQAATEEEKVHYIHVNPIRRGLVKRIEDWPWSSYPKYLKASQRRYRGEDLL